MKIKRTGSSFNAMSSKRELESVFLFTTGKCNAQCAMCFYAADMEQKAPDMTFDEIRKISESAGRFNRLWLSGGEPTMRDDLPEIIEMFYKNNHIKDINFPSNGIKNRLLVDWLKRIRKNCPDSNVAISISFDGFAAAHDAQRGIPSFYQAAEALKLIDDNFKDDGRIIKNIATVITRYNVDEILDFMAWVYGRFNVTTHTLEAARGMTREEGVKVLTEASLRKIQDAAAPYYLLYADRIGEGMSGLKRIIAKYFYVGLMRAMYTIRASNLDKPTPWNMDCTAGETTLVLDYDGRFRACELRPPVGALRDYNYDVRAVMGSEAMRKEIEAIGRGYKAGCWCTHGCWIMSSITFNPGRMISLIRKGCQETKRLRRPVAVDEKALRELEEKYKLDLGKLAEIGVIPRGAVPKAPAA
ncbi:MAG: radical SAM protein [Treponema sp.]|jgi:MoaA/NifB/PqqE/SkfB family radical SAM enzyme|nr:radical SAM protein [Treponema sp.]